MDTADVRELLYYPVRLLLFYLLLLPAAFGIVGALPLWLLLRPFGFHVRLNPLTYIEVAQDAAGAAASRAIGSHVQPPWPTWPWRRP